MSNYSKTQKRIPYDEWKRLHPEKYGPQPPYAGRGSYTVGRGKYSFKKFAKQAKKVSQSSVGKMVTRELKKLALAEADAMTGGQASTAVNMLGRGSYTVGRGAYYTNALINGDEHGQVAKTNGSQIDEHGTILVEKREFISSINATGSSDFSVQSFSINPALKSVFPWLSQTATNFDEYEMIQCIYEYEPVISDMSVSSVGSLGTIVLAANYNAGAAKFGSFPAMIEYGGAVRGRISDTISCGIEADPEKMSNGAHLYTRSGNVPEGQDIKTYDLAKFQIGMYGVPTAYVAGTQLGLLFVRYVVRLSKPKLYDSIGLSIGSDMFSGQVGNTTVLPLGTAPYFHNNNSIGGEISKTGATQTYTFPDNYVGTVQVTFYVTGTVVAAGIVEPLITILAGASITTQNYYPVHNSVMYSKVQSKGSNVIESIIQIVKVDLPNTPNANKLAFTTTNFPTGSTSGTVVVTEINPSIEDFYTNSSVV